MKNLHGSGAVRFKKSSFSHQGGYRVVKRVVSLGAKSGLRLAGAFVCLLSMVSASRSNETFTILRSDEAGMSIEFSLPDPEVKEVVIGGETFHTLSVGGVPLQEPAGYPRLEMFPALVGLPPQSDMQANLIPLETERLESMRLIPVSVNEPSDPMGYSSDYLEGGLFPVEQLQVEAPGLLRRQRVARLRVIPIRVDPSTGDVHVLKKARIELRFRGGRDGLSKAPAGEEPFEGVYRNSLLNYETARGWRERAFPAEAGQRSPFFEGEYWLKVIISDEGIYRITYSDILDAGLSPGDMDPVTFQVFYGGGRELPWSVTALRPELEETAIEVTGAVDGTFDPGDEIIFYGQSLLRWEPPDTYLRHRYDSNNCYWLTWGNPDAEPKRMTVVDGTPGPPGVEVATFRDNRHVEQDHIYVTEEFVYTSAVPDDWVWENVSGTHGVPISRTYTFQLDDLAGGGADSLNIELYGQAGTGTHFIEVSVNGTDVREISFTGASRYMSGWFSLPTDLLRTGSNTLSLYLPRNTLATADDAIYMGWFQVNALYSLGSAGEELVFNGEAGSGPVRYRLGGISASSPRVYRVTDPYDPEAVEGFSIQGDGLVFEIQTGTGRDRFVTLDQDKIRKPQSISLAENLTLRSTGNAADYLVITAPELEGEANDIAQFRAGREGMASMVITSDRIYNEFSWGIRDVTALRDFLKYAFESWSVAPTMALLLGDGHYDYKGFTTAGREKFNPLPPHISGDLVIEDWFVRFDSDANPDMICSRIPVRTAQEARVAIQKMMNYASDPEYGTWKSRTILVADDYYTEGRDCEGLEHTDQSEDVDRRLSEAMERVKIYLLEYPFDPPETGLEKPDATDDLLEEWNRGALLINFVGHGSYQTWAHEKAFHLPDDFPRLENGSRLPMIVAASCEIGRFDDPGFDGMVEEMLKTPGKGAIASFSATRATFSGPNRTINNNLIEELFRDPLENPYLGEAALTAKIRTGGSNAARYALFGDPASRLSLPGTEVAFTESPDSLRPMGLVTLSGEIRSGGEVAEDIDGFAEVRTYDPPVRKQYDECPTAQEFQTTGNRLFNGVASLSGGRFTATFRVPSNVPASLPADTSALRNAHIFAYLNWAGGDGYGVVDSIPVSLSPSPVQDSVPPSIRLVVNGRELADGDDLGAGQEIQVEISDESGINITGAPGHQILAEIDGGAVREDLTDGFRYDVDSHQNGSLRYRVPDLEPGDHRFEFRASDNAMNLAHSGLNLTVFPSSEVKLSQVLIYPNPVRDRCHFTFDVTQPSEITIKIYTVAGRLIRRLERNVGVGYNQIEWDGRDWRGDVPANGVYLCHVTARSAAGGNGAIGEDEQLVKALLAR